MKSTKWILPSRQITSEESKLAQKMELPKVIIKLLFQRNIKSPQDIQRFLHPGFQNMGDPFQMHDMKKGIALIKDTIAKHEKITIYGDYDTDGITATTIMYLGLKHCYPKANIHFFTPSRFKDGYGPNWNEYERIIDNGTKLLITVDNGIMGKQVIDKARKRGLKVIITDHHDFPKTKDGHFNEQAMPEANACIMAKYPSHQYNPDSQGNSKEDFCGAGIAFKIITALWGRIPKELAYIAALGTIADSVSLTYEDRDIVYEGVKELRHTKSPGIQALAQICMGNNWQKKLGSIHSHDLSFNIIPRLNALGRIGTAMNGVKLLITKDKNYARQLAIITEKSNRKRKKLQNIAAAQAIKEANEPQHKNDPVEILANKNWFPGTVGIVASHVLEATYKPALVIGHLSSDPDNIYRGSGRSIPGFDLNAHMQAARKYMVSEGGHPMACGFTVKKEQIPKLKQTLEANSKSELADSRQEIKPDLYVDASSITEDLYHDVEKLEPFGVGNEVPQIAIKVPKIYGVSPMGKTPEKRRKYLQFRLTPDWNNTVKVISFTLGRYTRQLQDHPDNIELTGTMEDNYFRGKHSVEINLVHIRHYQSVPPLMAFGQLYDFLKTASHQNEMRDGQGHDRGFGQIKCQNLYSLAQMIKDQGVMTNYNDSVIVKMLEVVIDANAGKMMKDAFFVNNDPQRYKTLPLTENKTYQNWLKELKEQ